MTDGYRTVLVGTDGSETSFRAYVPEEPDPHAQDVLGDEAYQQRKATDVLTVHTT